LRVGLGRESNILNREVLGDDVAPTVRTEFDYGFWCASRNARA
jgi:hypothetical protein